MLEGLRKPAELVMIVVGLLAYGCPLQAIVHVFGLDERTVAAWRDRAGQQCQRVQQAVVEQGKLTLTHVQADEIRVKGKKGILWMGLAMEVSSRLWLAGVVQPTRDRVLADRLLQAVRRCACGASQLLVCVDGWAAYPNAILRAFPTQMKQGIQASCEQMQFWPQLIIGQVIKTQKKYRLVEVQHTLLRGDEQGLEQCIEQSHGGTQINTSYIERFNGTMRERVTHLYHENVVMPIAKGQRFNGECIWLDALTICVGHIISWGKHLLRLLVSLIMLGASSRCSPIKFLHNCLLVRSRLNNETSTMRINPNVVAGELPNIISSSSN